MADKFYSYFRWNFCYNKEMDYTLYDLYQKMLTEMGPTNWCKQQIVVEAILIQNTTEKNATRASQLIAEVSRYDFNFLANMDNEELQELVRPAGFMKNKSRAIQEVAAWFLAHNEDWIGIKEQYGAELRQTLLGLRGIGPETADVFLAYIFDEPQFVADKYARTLFTHLGVENLTDYQSLSRRLQMPPAPFTYQDAQEFHGLIDEFGKLYFRRGAQFSDSFLGNSFLIF